jgi:hypothetical protein
VRASFWWGWLTATAVVFAVFWALLHALGVDPRPGPLLLLVGLVMAVLALVNINLTADGPSWDVHSSQPVTEPGQDARLAMYTRALSGHLDAKTVDPVLRDRLADLAAARLRQRHGVGLRDPAAEDLLGSEVADLLTGPPRRLARGEIETAVRRIEGL